MCGFTGLVGMTERQEPQEQADSAGEEGGAYLPTTRGGGGDTSKRGCSSTVCVGLGMRKRRMGT